MAGIADFLGGGQAGAILSGIGGVAGLFSRKKKSKNELLSEQYSNANLQNQLQLMPQQQALQKQMISNAAGLTPQNMDAALRQYLESVGQHNIDLGQRQAQANAARNGMSSGDTQGVVLRQQSLNQAWNPVAGELARINSEAPFKIANAQAQALGQSGAGNTNYANQVTANRDNRQPEDLSGSALAVGNAIEGLLPKKKKTLTWDSSQGSNMRKNINNAAAIGGSIAGRLRW